MTNLVLNKTEKVRLNISNFERFLKAYDLTVVRRSDKHDVIELTVNARFHEQAKWVTGLAFDFFESALTSVTTNYEEVAIKRAA
jgi:hypothetical protein